MPPYFSLHMKTYVHDAGCIPSSHGSLGPCITLHACAPVASPIVQVMHLLFVDVEQDAELSALAPKSGAEPSCHIIVVSRCLSGYCARKFMT